MYTTGYMECLINIEPPVFTEILDPHLSDINMALPPRSLKMQPLKIGKKSFYRNGFHSTTFYLRHNYVVNY